jgi:hypothetical protein
MVVFWVVGPLQNMLKMEAVFLSKRWHTAKIPHGTTTQKTTIFICIAVKTLNPTTLETNRPLFVDLLV